MWRFVAAIQASPLPATARNVGDHAMASLGDFGHDAPRQEFISFVARADCKCKIGRDIGLRQVAVPVAGVQPRLREPQTGGGRRLFERTRHIVRKSVATIENYVARDSWRPNVTVFDRRGITRVG